jgi:hypothetical protein
MLRFAMWSGPRNISTAMMRSWGNRPDTFVCDEPLYAHYLLASGAPHPGADEVIARHETDWRKVVAWLTGPVPEGKAIFYQKHMAHHLLPHVDRGWLGRVTSAFLLREPREMLTSLARFIAAPRIEDTGLPQQQEIFDWVRSTTGAAPPVLDARDVLDRPEAMLRQLCARLDVAFTPAMLSWPPGPRPSDGVWARHWYAAVYETTSFGPYRPKDEPVPPRLADVLAQADAIYQRLYDQRLRP